MLDDAHDALDPSGAMAARAGDRRGETPSPLSSLPKVRAFAAGAAAVFEWATVQSAAAAAVGLGQHTLNVEMAAPSPGSTGMQRRYDWRAKLVLQLLPQELLHFAAVTLGWQQEFNARFHGASRRNGLTLRQNPGDGSLFLSLSCPGRSLSMPLPVAERTALALLCTKVLVANHAPLSDTVVFHIIQRTLAPSRAATESPAAQPAPSASSLP